MTSEADRTILPATQLARMMKENITSNVEMKAKYALIVTRFATILEIKPPLRVEVPLPRVAFTPAPRVGSALPLLVDAVDKQRTRSTQFVHRHVTRANKPLPSIPEEADTQPTPERIQP